MKILFEQFKKNLILEMTKNQFGYHCTNVDPEIIKREGFKVGNNGFTKENMFEDDLYQKYLPKIPVFISAKLKTDYYRASKYCIVLDIDGLDLYPDFGSLIDIGAYYDENEWFYWNSFRDIENSKLRQFVRAEYGEPILYAKDFTGELSWELIKSACLDGQQDLKNRIIKVIET